METDRRANRRTATRLKRGKQADRRSIPLIGRFARRPNCDPLKSFSGLSFYPQGIPCPLLVRGGRAWTGRTTCLQCPFFQAKTCFASEAGAWFSKGWIFRSDPAARLC